MTLSQLEPYQLAIGEVASEPNPLFAIPDAYPESVVFNHSQATRVIWQYSRARLVSPWAVLGAVLARVTAAVEPTVMLPGIVGGLGSLNLFVGLVGESGTGKGSAERVASTVVEIVDSKGFTVDSPPIPLGSGEGIAQYFKPHKDLETGENVAKTRGLFTCAEIAGLAATANKRGSRILEVLCRVYSGEGLGEMNAQEGTTRLIPAHGYRMSLVVGIQPTKASVLLDDADAGTPQRFLWFKVTDPDFPKHLVQSELPDPPEPCVLQLGNQYTSNERHVLKVCPQAVGEIKQARLETYTEAPGRDPLDGHRLLTQLKVAAALAILAGGLEVTEDDWTAARAVMEHSRKTRKAVQDAMDNAGREARTKRAEARGQDAVAAEEAKREARLERYRKRVIQYLQTDMELTESALFQKFKSKEREGGKEALSTLIEEGHVISTPKTAPNGVHTIWLSLPRE